MSQAADSAQTTSLSSGANLRLPQASELRLHCPPGALQTYEILVDGNGRSPQGRVPAAASGPAPGVVILAGADNHRD